MKRLIIIFLVLSIFALSYGITPYNERSDDFEATITTKVTQKTNGVEFHYTIYYDANNKRDLVKIKFNFPNIIPMSEFVQVYGIADRNIEWFGSHTTNNGWTHLPFFARGEKGKEPKEPKWIYVNENMILQTCEEDLKPGEKLDIYITIKGKEIIPGVASLDGYCNQAEWVFEDAGDAPDDFDTGYHPKTFKVVGPVPKPTKPIAMIDKLNETTTEAYNLGWIAKQDVYAGLMDKLIAAKEHIIAGFLHYHTAKNILGAFKHLLDAQRGKAIDEPTYQMLTIDADLMIGML